MRHRHVCRAGMAWAPTRPSRAADALGNYSSDSPKFSQTGNYTPQPRPGKEPEEAAPAWRRQAGGWHFSSVLPRAGGEGAKPSWDFAYPASAEPHSQLVLTLLRALVPSFSAISSCCSQHKALEPADMPCRSDHSPLAARSPGKSGCLREVALRWLIEHGCVFQ